MEEPFLLESYSLLQMTLYDRLGLDVTATAEEIKRAFRRVSLRCHPDKLRGDPTAEERFKGINTAHAILSCPFRRWLYNKYGEESVPFDKAVGLVATALQESEIPAEFGIPEDILEALQLGETGDHESDGAARGDEDEEEDLLLNEDDGLLLADEEDQLTDEDEDSPMDVEEYAEYCRDRYQQAMDERMEVDYISIEDEDEDEEEDEELPDVESWKLVPVDRTVGAASEAEIPRSDEFSDIRRRLRVALLNGDVDVIIMLVRDLEACFLSRGMDPRRYITTCLLQTLKFIRRDMAWTWAKGRGRRKRWTSDSFRRASRTIRELVITRFELFDAGALLGLLKWCARVVTADFS